MDLRNIGEHLVLAGRPSSGRCEQTDHDWPRIEDWNEWQEFGRIEASERAEWRHKERIVLRAEAP